MTFGFLFWLFLAGLVIASLQDLKRREVDDWLNLFLLVSGISFLLFESFRLENFKLFFFGIFFVIIVYLLANLFYYGHVFAGGDAKLLVVLTPLFVSLSFLESAYNIALFLFLLMVSGSVYGIGYSSVLYFRDFKKVNKEIKKQLLSNSWAWHVILAGVGLLLFSFFDFVFIFLAILVLLFPLLHVFAKGLEKVSMVKTLSGKELREGDWLVGDVRVGEKIVRADWDGLTSKNLEILRRLKKVKIKEGIPFVPAFLLAFLVYSFFGVKILEIFLNLF